MSKKTTRRKFLITSAAVAGGVIGNSALTQKQLSSADAAGQKTMPERILGRTGVSVPILGLGGAGQTPLSQEGKEKDAIALVERALKLGIRYYDTAADYGPSEGYLGKILPSYRSQVFLASKTAGRNRDDAWRDLERSLKRLNTDRLELWQLHHVSFDEQIEQIFAKNGAIKAIEEAKAQKIIKYTGITGHHEPDIIAKGLQRYPFDTTLISLNAADIHHPRPFHKTVLPIAKKNNVGVIAMKVPAYGKLFKPGALKGMEQALGYVMSMDGVHTSIIAAENPEQLESNVRVAQAYKPLDTAQMKEIEQLTAKVWEENTFFRAWT